MSKGVYKIRHVLDNLYPDWRDGVRSQYYTVTKKVHHTMGWNDLMNPKMVSYHITYDPATGKIERLPDVPATPRHTHGFGELNNKLWLWGWASVPDGAMDVLSYDGTAWTKHMDDWQFEKLTHSNYTTHKHWLYTCSGYIQSSTPYVYVEKIYRIDVLDLAAGWKFVAYLPSFLHKKASGALVSFQGNLVLMGGGEMFIDGRNTTNSMIPNTKVGLSTDDGFTWEQKADSPLFNSGLWPAVACNKDVVIFSSGSDYDNDMDKNNRIIVTEDLINYQHLGSKVTPSHARAFTADEYENFWLSMGNGCNDLYQIKKIADQTKFFEN